MSLLSSWCWCLSWISARYLLGVLGCFYFHLTVTFFCCLQRIDRCIKLCLTFPATFVTSGPVDLHRLTAIAGSGAMISLAVIVMLATKRWSNGVLLFAIQKVPWSLCEYSPVHQLVQSLSRPIVMHILPVKEIHKFTNDGWEEFNSINIFLTNMYAQQVRHLIYSAKFSYAKYEQVLMLGHHQFSTIFW